MWTPEREAVLSPWRGAAGLLLLCALPLRSTRPGGYCGEGGATGRASARRCLDFDPSWLDLDTPWRCLGNLFWWSSSSLLLGANSRWLARAADFGKVAAGTLRDCFCLLLLRCSSFLSSGVPDLAVADRWNCPCVMTMPRSASRLVQPHEPVRGDLPLSSNHHHRSARTSRILESPLSSPRIFACAKVSAASWMRSRTTRQAPQLACQNSHQNRQAPAWINFSQ